MKILVVLLLTLFSGATFASELKTKEITVQEKNSDKPVNSVCPVSGEEVDSDVTYVFEGKTYALCCKSCLKKFKKDPKSFISALSEDGKSWDKSKISKKKDK